jgi:RimJ/RimL family protein N-acetyltransferase
MQENRVNVSWTRQGHLPDLLRLWNDGRVMRWVHIPDGLGYDLGDAARWLDRVDANPDQHHFVVHHDDIGFCGELNYRVDGSHNSASLDIKFVPEAQGKGLATRAFQHLIDLVFTAEPGVDAVWVEPWPENAAAQRLYARCGLRPRPRPAHLLEGPSYWELRKLDWHAGRYGPGSEPSG